MADNKEFESIDKLFRQTFDNLPETPASNGWDMPSDRVWSQVQTNLRPEKTSWYNGKTGWLVSASAIVIALGLYFALTRETVEKPAQQEQTTVIEQPAVVNVPAEINTPAAPAEETVTVSTATDSGKRKIKTNLEKAIQATTPANSPANHLEKNNVTSKPAMEAGTTAPVKDKPAVRPPNSVERNKIKEQLHSKITAPLKMLPLRGQSGPDFPPAVPASLKNIPLQNEQE